MSIEPSPTEAAIERAWTSYLESTPDTTRLALEAGARAAVANWLRRHTDDLIPAIARAVAGGADGNDPGVAPIRAPKGGGPG
jgi:hypothetical protein